MLFVRLFDLRLFGFVCFHFLFVSGMGCSLSLWHSLDFFLTVLTFLLYLIPVFHLLQVYELSDQAMAHPVFSKPKQLRPSTDYSKCLICQKTNISGNAPLRNVTDLGYEWIKTAVETWTDVALRLSSEIIDKSAFLLKQPKCHKTCKGNYSSTKSIKQQHGKH